MKTMIENSLRQTFHRRHAIKLAGALGMGAALPLTRRGLTSSVAAQAEVWDSPPVLAKAAEQAKDFQTYGMPDDWANYGGVLKAFAEKYEFVLSRTDTDMTSMEEITKYDAEKANPVAVSSDIGLIYGPIAEEVGVVPPYLPPTAKTLPTGLKGTNGGWVATFTGVPAIIVNTEVISTVPETWDDLLAAEFAGKIGIRDPRTAGEGAVAFLAWAYANGGDESNLGPGIEFAQKLLPQFAPKEGLPELEKGEIPVAIKYDFNALAWAAAAKEKGINTTVVIPGVSVYGPSALMINKYNTAKADLAKLLLDFVLTDEAQTAFAEFGARPIRYVLGDLELPDTAKTKWLPDADYQDVKQVQDWSQVDANVIAETWDTEVLDG
jgi:putative spermidine/putrescine transport system substrate-binding protein